MSQPARERTMHRMHARRRWNGRGLSEIVGTLMLVVIVVAAATAFSFFVASYEKTLLAQENANHIRSLEAVDMLAVHSSPRSLGSPEFGSLTFTFASADVNSMQIIDILVDGNALLSYNLTNLSSGKTTEIGILTGENSSSFVLPPLEQVIVRLDLGITLGINNTSKPDNLFSFLSLSDVPSATSYLEIEIQTQLGNDFKFVYVPPTPIADLTFVQSVNSNGVIGEIPVLDGTHAFQQGGNATIVAWDWVVTDESQFEKNYTEPVTWTGSGAQFELTNVTSFVDSNYSYSAILTVFNSLGLFAVGTPISFQG